MDKLNYLRPHQDNILRPHINNTDKHLSNLYSKNHHKLNISSSQQQSMKSNTRLTIGKGEGKENMNDMIMRRYTHMMRNK